MWNIDGMMVGKRKWKDSERTPTQFPFFFNRRLRAVYPPRPPPRSGSWCCN